MTPDTQALVERLRKYLRRELPALADLNALADELDRLERELTEAREALMSIAELGDPRAIELRRTITLDNIIERARGALTPEGASEERP